MMKYLQKLGKALMLPVAVLPICGILMGLGYALAPGVMGVPGAATSGAAYTVGFLLVKAGGALIDNMAWLFAIGAAVGLADNDGTAGLAGLVSYLMMQQLLSPGVVGMVRTLEEGTATYIAFQKVAGNSFIGILAAVVGAACYNKFKNTQLPDWLAFFSGKRFVAIATGLISILVSVVLLFVWPVIFDALVAIGNGIAGMDGIGAGIYAFLNRLLIPTGLPRSGTGRPGRWCRTRTRCSERGAGRWGSADGSGRRRCRRRCRPCQRCRCRWPPVRRR